MDTVRLWGREYGECVVQDPSCNYRYSRHTRSFTTLAGTPPSGSSRGKGSSSTTSPPFSPTNLCHTLVRSDRPPPVQKVEVDTHPRRSALVFVFYFFLELSINFKLTGLDTLDLFYPLLKYGHSYW